jgi:hypothetical protein
MDNVLLNAITACRAQYGDDRWLAMDPGEQTAAIYREMRRLDLEKAIALGLPIATEVVRAPGVPSPADPHVEQTASVEQGKSSSPRCSATIKTRATDHCSWRATVWRNGQPYCGFHDPERRNHPRRDQGNHEPEVSRRIGRLQLELVR